MARIKLEEQPAYEFQYPVVVQITDINYGGHLGNDALVRLIHEARVHLLYLLGCREFDLGDGQTGLIIADLVVNFKAESFLFDPLRIDSHVGEFSRTSFRLFHRATRNGELIALAETGLVSFNYAGRKSVSVPAAFKQALAEYLERRG